MQTMFASEPVRVAVPATSANLGPGYDTLGLALALEDEVSAQVTAEGFRVEVSGEGADEVAEGPDHLIVRTMMRTFDLLGARPGGLSLTCHNRIPHARGLGSSSAAIVAGIVLARSLVVGGAGSLDDAAALRLAAEIEGHPDNVAPCLLGGFTIAWTDAPRPPDPDPALAEEAEKSEKAEKEKSVKVEGARETATRAVVAGGARAVRIEPVAGLRPMVFIPSGRGLTAHARAALPAMVPHADAAFNAARAALLVHAITADPSLLMEATEDRLHQDYRAAGMPETAALVRSLRRSGVAAFVSGAGPSVLALPIGAIPEAPEGWCGRSLSVSSTGARILIGRHAEGDPVAAGPPS